MKLSFKTILPIILISALLILLAGCYCNSPVPSADAGGTYNDEVCPGEDSTITFAGSGSGTGTLVYDWDFGDGTTALDAGPNPSHTYLQPFTGSPYTVTLTVTDKCGSVEVTTTVEITQCNTAPKVEDIPLQAISAEGEVLCIPTYEFSGYASDDEDDNLTYSWVSDVPTGMSLDPNSGKIIWDPVCPVRGDRCHQCGTVCVTVRVLDDGCCQPLYTDVEICIEVFNGPVDGEGGTLVGIGFDGCPISDGLCN